MRPALQPVAEHFGHGHGGQRRLAQFAVADRERQHVRPRRERARLVDQGEARRMGQARQVAGGRRQPDADEADVVVAERARRGDRHHLGRRAGHPGTLAAMHVLLHPGRETRRGRARFRPTRCRRHCRAGSSRGRRTAMRPAGPEPPRRASRPAGSRRSRSAARSRPRSPPPSPTARRAASTASFCTPTMPSISTLPSRSAFCAWTMVTSGRSAGTHASSSPVNGTGDKADVRG